MGMPPPSFTLLLTGRLRGVRGQERERYFYLESDMRLKGGGLVLIVKIILARYFIVHTPSFTRCVVVVVFI